MRFNYFLLSRHDARLSNRSHRIVVELSAPPVTCLIGGHRNSYLMDYQRMKKFENRSFHLIQFSSSRVYETILGAIKEPSLVSISQRRRHDCCFVNLWTQYQSSMVLQNLVPGTLTSFFFTNDPPKNHVCIWRFMWFFHYHISYSQPSSSYVLTRTCFDNDILLNFKLFINSKLWNHTS